MKVFGKEVTASRLLEEVQIRLQARGLVDSSATTAATHGAAPVDPMAFLVESMSANAEAAQGLPLETHRGGVAGVLVVRGKSMLRAVTQGFLNEVLARQTRFNGYVRDGYAQLAAEVVQLRERLAALEQQGRLDPASRVPRGGPITPPTPPDVWRPAARRSPPVVAPPDPQQTPPPRASIAARVQESLVRPPSSAPPPRPARTPSAIAAVRPTPPPLAETGEVSAPAVKAKKKAAAKKPAGPRAARRKS